MCPTTRMGLFIRYPEQKTTHHVHLGTTSHTMTAKLMSTSPKDFLVANHLWVQIAQPAWLLDRRIAKA